jgi:transcriptional regulator with XRE-family HTH domain
MPDRHLRRAGAVRRASRERAAYLARRIGVALREARLGAGLRQRQAAARAGVAQSFWSRLERGATTAVSLETVAGCAAAVGLQLAAYLESAPGASLPRDIEHLRRQALVVALAAKGGWRATPEAAVADDRPRPRSIDVLLVRPERREVAVVEIWDLLLDGGEAMRGLEAKVLATRKQLGPDWHVQGLLVVRGTQRNRRLVRELAACSGHATRRHRPGGSRRSPIRQGRCREAGGSPGRTWRETACSLPALPDVAEVNTSGRDCRRAENRRLARRIPRLGAPVKRRSARRSERGSVLSPGRAGRPE